MTNFYCNNKVPRSLSSSFFLSLSLSHSQTHTDSRTQLIYSPVAGLNSLFLVHSLSLSFLPTQHPSLPLSYSFKNSISLPLSLSLSYSLVNISLLILDTGANTLTLSFSNPFLSHTISLPLSLSLLLHCFLTLLLVKRIMTFHQGFNELAFHPFAGFSLKSRSSFTSDRLR